MAKIIEKKLKVGVIGMLGLIGMAINVLPIWFIYMYK